MHLYSPKSKQIPPKTVQTQPIATAWPPSSWPPRFGRGLLGLDGVDADPQEDQAQDYCPADEGPADFHRAIC